ncbi:MAG: hypothetical protein Q9195_008460 [Heterodermia aff. obscurata]
MTGRNSPAPYSWPPSQSWDGDDGAWSSFYVRVGTPEQPVRVLPSTAGQATWVVMDGGCPSSSPASCSDDRGRLVNLNESSSRDELGVYTLELELNLGHNDTGEFGLDTLGLGTTAPSGGPSLDSQLVIGIETNNYRLGTFGLNHQPTNVSSFAQSYTSFLTSLKLQNLIPSLSWAYTAGAKYRSKGVFGSLTLGGYDASRFTPNDVSFTLASDAQRDLVVGLQSIIADYGNGTWASLLPIPILTFIDSTLPYIYLPAAACQAFESQFGLVWNSTYNLYFLDETLHQKLIDLNLNFTFTIGNEVTGHPIVDIVLPYASFDQLMGPPILANNTPYFPIRRAVNDTQYTLGRTFLQEAYVITNYDNSTFSVAQSRFDDGAQAQIIAIHPDSSTAPSDNSTAPPTKSQIGRGTEIGIATGSSIALLVILIVIGFLVRHWRMKVKRRTEKDLSIGNIFPESKNSLGSFPQEIGRNSLRNSYSELHGVHTAELLDEGMISGSGKDVKELPDWQEQALHELDTGTMQYSELHDMSTAELPSQDMEPGWSRENKKLSSGSTDTLQDLDPTSDSRSSTAVSEPQEMHTNRFTFLRIREKIATASPMGAPSSSAKRWSETPLSKPRPTLAVASSKSSPLVPVSKYNTRSK